MQDVTVTFVAGPLQGHKYEFEVGRVVIGRLPGSGGLELTGADSSVSRAHAELMEQDGDVELRNLSPNGTRVDGKLIIDKVTIQSGARIEIGPNHPFEIEWASYQQHFATDLDKTLVSRPVAKQGPLSSPIVRSVIGVYLAAIAGVAIWLGLSSADETIAADDWPALEAAYVAFDAGELSDAERQSRLAQAELLIRELRALRTRGGNREIESICREIMRIDRKTESPLFQYGAQCLASL